MSQEPYQGPERRKFIRLEYVTPVAYKVCKPEIIAKLLEGYSSDISEAGLLCSLKSKVQSGDILWLSFDRSTLLVCEELEKRSLIYQNGVIGKVMRLQEKNDGTFDVGIQFITREEKNDTYIYPKIHFLMMQGKTIHHSDDAQQNEDHE
ncbi:MAG: PilZ domain-containing protein [Candidatus Omnitrophica bacterium]|nr:PilZ domain-containing protein [Candidatus Omnitrophota bacterium]